MLIDYFILKETNDLTHSWTLTSFDSNNSPMESLAEELADRIVQHQCRGSPHLYEAWRRQAEGNEILSNPSQLALRAFLDAVFGPPGEIDAVNKDHLEGFVAELLWYFLCLEIPTDEIVRTEPPGFKSTDPGADSLIVHRISNEYLMFRLWEMKKYAPITPKKGRLVGTTVKTAFNQLNLNALEYLARYTAIGQEIDDEELSEFYGQLVELWVEASHQAAAGVSVATSIIYVQDTCFSEFGEYFPGFVDPVRLRGMLTSIDDFSVFTLKVQEVIWKGL